MGTQSKDEDVKLSFKMRLLSAFIKLVDGFVYRKDGTVNRKLQTFLEAKTNASAEPQNGVSTKDVKIDAATGVWVRVFSCSPPQGAGEEETKVPVIVLYHGGGFVALAADNSYYDELGRKLAGACGATVVAPNYRLAPEFPYPAAYDDCYKVFDWLRSDEARAHLPPTDLARCFLAGDSAGGNIAHFMACRAAENGISPIQLRGLVSLQPFFGGEELTPAEKELNPPILPVATCHWAWRAFLPGQTRDHPNVNVFGPNSPDISGLSLPPMFVAIGSNDILKDREEDYVEKLRAMGKDVTAVRYPGGCHAFYVFMEELKQKCLDDVIDFIRSHIA